MELHDFSNFEDFLKSTRPELEKPLAAMAWINGQQARNRVNLENLDKALGALGPPEDTVLPGPEKAVILTLTDLLKVIIKQNEQTQLLTMTLYSDLVERLNK